MYTYLQALHELLSIFLKHDASNVNVKTLDKNIRKLLPVCSSPPMEKLHNESSEPLITWSKVKLIN